MNGNFVHHRDRNHDNGNTQAKRQQLDDFHNGGHQFGLVTGTVFDLAGEFGGIGFVTDFFGTSSGIADNNSGTRKNGVPHLFLNIIRFTGEHGLIHLYFTG